MSPLDAHLFEPGRKRILSLDGGGIRGILSISLLERLEEVVGEIEGRPTRLGEWFDLIAGTSTGSIIATLLALGYRVSEIRTFYERLGPRIFKPRRLRLFGWNAKFDARVLASEIERVVEGRTLSSTDLLTGLCIMMKRLDTGSAWIVSNNPRSMFWEDPQDGSYVGNRRMQLDHLIRASTAAPSFFDPEPISVIGGQVPGIFIDGGLTPHNNPALMAVMMALVPAYGLNWPSGPDDLLVVSIGTGSFRPSMTLAQARASSGFGLAVKSLAAIIAENQQLVLTLMTYFGQSAPPWPINSEIGDLAPILPPGGKLFRFARYDVRLETDWLTRELGETVAPDTVLKLRRMDDPSNIEVLSGLGRKAASRQIEGAHLAPFRRGDARP